MTPENQQLREALSIGFQKIYDEMITFINKMNLNKQLKDYAFQNFDQGMFWVRTAIHSLALPQPEETPPSPDEPKVDASVEKPAEDIAV